MGHYQVKPHNVTGSRIERIEPFVAHGKMLAPNAGLVLILDDRTKETWVPERHAVVPNIGDYLVKDDELRTSCLVPAAKFAELFAEEQPQ